MRKQQQSATDVYTEYERDEAKRAATSYVVTLHYDEHPMLGSYIVWQGQGYWEAQRWAQGAAKSLICTTAHGHVDFTPGGMTHNAYREDFSQTGTRMGASYILVGHVSVEEVQQPESPPESPPESEEDHHQTQPAANTTTVGLFEELARIQRTLDTVRENGANLMRSVNESAERHGWGAANVRRGLDLIEDLQREEARLIERRRQLRVAAALVAARAS